MAKLVIAGSSLSLLCLTLLHFVSPEFNPSWRMISEYALGEHKWLLTCFFLLGAISTLLLSILLWKNVSAWWAYLGVILIFISGIGGMMGGFFDVKHPLHGAAFALGVPTFPIGVLLASYNIIKQEQWRNHRLSILLSAHSTWLGVLLVAITMVVLFSGFKKAGIPFGPNVEPPKTLPEGVIALNGYANRLLLIFNFGWAVTISGFYLSNAKTQNNTAKDLL